MMVREYFLPNKMESPSSKILEESLRIPNRAEGEAGQVEEVRGVLPNAFEDRPKPGQLRLCAKNLGLWRPASRDGFDSLRGGLSLRVSGDVRPAGAFQGSCQDHYVSPCQRRERFAEAAGGEQAGVVIFHGVEENDIEGSSEAQVLEAVVEDMGVNLEALFGRESGAVAVGGDDDGHVGQLASQHRRLVADCAGIGHTASRGLDGYDVGA